MTVDKHADWFTVVRDNWRRTQGFLLASREPCLTIRRHELAAVRGRALASRDPTDLATWSPPDSWLLAVVLCPGDTVEPIVAWLRRGKRSADRVWFYLHPSTPLETLRPWVEEGFPTDQAATVSNWRELHRLFGLALNDRIYSDWKEAPVKS